MHGKGGISPEPGSRRGGQEGFSEDRCCQWALWRQDDNGLKFLVCIRKTRQEAEEKQKAFERHRHKQLYFVEPFPE